jgi:hypothetical protein
MTNKKKNNISKKKRKYFNGFENYNKVRSELSVYLKSKGKPYTKKEFNNYVNDLYGKIKSKTSTQQQISLAVRNIDVFIGQYFSQGLTLYSKVDRFEWWSISDKVGMLPADYYVVVDNSELLTDSLEKEYEGRASGYGFSHRNFVSDINKLLKRKDYAFYLQYVFRDEDSGKEFSYFLLLSGDDYRLDFSEEEFREYLEYERIFNIGEFYSRITLVTDKKDSLIGSKDVFEATFEKNVSDIVEKEAKKMGIKDSEVKKMKKRLTGKDKVKKKAADKKVQPKKKTKPTGKKTGSTKDLIALEKEKQKTLKEIAKLVKLGIPYKDVLKMIKK